MSADGPDPTIAVPSFSAKIGGRALARETFTSAVMGPVGIRLRRSVAVGTPRFVIEASNVSLRADDRRHAGAVRRARRGRTLRREVLAGARLLGARPLGA